MLHSIQYGVSTGFPATNVLWVRIPGAGGRGGLILLIGSKIHGYRALTQPSAVSGGSGDFVWAVSSETRTRYWWSFIYQIPKGYQKEKR